MTDTWWPKRGAARRLVDDAWKGIWFRGLRSLGIRPRKFYTTRHTFIAWAFSEGANMKGLVEYCSNSVQMIEQSYSRYIRKATAHSVRLIPAAFVQCGSGIIRPHHAHRGRTATLSGSSDRSVANLSTT